MSDLALYDYDLPSEVIAQSPIEPRDASRLLLVPRDGSPMRHMQFRDLPSLLDRGDLLVLNDTRVSARRLVGKRPSGGEVELLLLRKVEGRRFEAMVRPARRLQPGAAVLFDNAPTATVLEALDQGLRLVEFEDELAHVGEIPLPPYYHGDLPDEARYQTVFAQANGSAAAPTAGLHFTRELLADVEERGVHWATVTLHIGLDTFRPISAEVLDGHSMHGEAYTVSSDAAHAIRQCQGRIIGVGTTSVRVLESLGERDQVQPGEQITRLFIREGYCFRCAEGIITNFHLPRTTMLVMICAFAGRERVLSSYETAKAAGYRFLSFGDAMAIL